MDSPLRWGLIGTGGIAATFAEDLQRTDSGRVVAVGSRRQESADAFAERFAIANRHPSYEALVEDPEVDAVYVATPHPMHLPDATLALRAGKPVLVEKPFTMDASQAREVVALARAQGVFAMEAMWTRFLPHVRTIREILALGELGQIVTVFADHGQWFAADRSHRLYSPELGGGALLDLGIYPVSFASLVLGTPERIRAATTAAFTGVDAQTSMVFSYPSGAQAVLSCTLAAKSATRAAIVGTRARIEIAGEFYRPTSFEVITKDGERTAHPLGSYEGNGLRHEADEVARCLREGLLESPLMPLDETVSIMETMDEVAASAKG